MKISFKKMKADHGILTFEHKILFNTALNFFILK
jgi:hypothetical protein